MTLRINGHRVIAVLPRIKTTGEIDGYAIVAERSDGECVSAIVNEPTDGSWNWGHYFGSGDVVTNRRKAVKDAIERAREAG